MHVDQKQIDEAADRLRRHYEASKPSGTNSDSPYWVNNGWNNNFLEDDESVLALAHVDYLMAKAEREERDAMPLTKEDWVSFGLECPLRYRAVIYLLQPDESDTRSIELVPCKTYGDFRRLCKVFGIEVKP